MTGWPKRNKKFQGNTIINSIEIIIIIVKMNALRVKFKEIIVKKIELTTIIIILIITNTIM